MSEPLILKGPALDSKYESCQSFHAFILETARKYSTRVFMVEHATGKDFTYGQFMYDILRVANGLISVNEFATGDVFLVYGYNSYEYLVAYFAGLVAGGLAVGVRGEDTEYELTHEIHVREVKWVFIQEELSTVIPRVYKECPGVKILLFDTSVETNSNFKATTVGQLIRNSEPLSEELIFKPKNTKETPAVILESSGTTGPAKGTYLSHYSLTMTFCGAAKFTQAESEDIFLHSSPMAHLSALQAFGIPFKMGAKIVMVRKSSPQILVEVIPKYKISKAVLSLSNINVLSNWPQKCDLSSLRRVLTGGVKIVSSSVAKFIDRYKPDEFFNCYGMTESGGVVCEVDLCSAHKSNIRLDCVGKVLPGVQLKVISTNTGQLLGPNQSGELCIKTPFRFLKYHNDPERTKVTLDEEDWIHSGDVAFYDENGYVYIVDRIKDIIDQNGFHFSPADIEEVLLQHSEVVDACAVGIPEEGHSGHLAHAFVIKKEGSEVAEDELKIFVNERISEFKQIKGSVHFVSEFPMTAFGKVKRRAFQNETVS